MFNEEFLELLKKRGVSPYKLAKELDIPKSLVYDWRNGVRVPSAENLVKLSGYFGVPLARLLGSGEYGEYDETEEDLMLLLHAARRLSKQDHDELVGGFKKSIELYLRAKGERV